MEATLAAVNVAASCASTGSADMCQSSSGHHFLPESLRVCMFVYARSRQTNGSLFSASHQCALEAKQGLPARQTSLCRLGHLCPGPGIKNGECIGRIRPE